MGETGAAAPNPFHNGEQPEEAITDWYLPKSGWMDGFIYPGHIMVRDHPRLYDMASGLLERCQQQQRFNKGYPDFRLREGHRVYRVHFINNLGGGIYALRRMPSVIPRLGSIGLPGGIYDVLTHAKLNHGGVVMICGETGQGKSTTCASMIQERMMLHNTFTLTIEDPVEAPLEGAHGGGHCLQTEVVGGNFPEAMKGAMRSYPVVPGSMLYIGEIRDRETAAEALRIATNGHLVLTTIHANGVIQSLQRLMGMAEESMGRKDAQEVLASTLRLVMHQVLEVVPARAGQPLTRRLKVEFLMSGKSDSSVAGTVRDGKLVSLVNEIDIQRQVLKMKGIGALFS